MTKNLEKIARQLVEKKKGVLAADESIKTMTKRLESVGIESTLKNRCLWREIILKTQGIEKFISGVILYDETLRTPMSDGKKIVEFLKEKNILVGIKVDEGIYKFNDQGESFTLGLDRLEKRLIEYQKMGCVFTKWRAVYQINSHLPSEAAIIANNIGLSQYALISQKNHFVPIVEPEILVLEGDHSIEKSYQITKNVLKNLFYWLSSFKIHFKGMLLKPNMVLAGKRAKKQPSIDEVVDLTVKVLKETVPSDVAGIVFLSGGLSPDEATDYLREMNRRYKKLPWPLSFSFGRALQQEGLKTWKGKKENIKKAQETCYRRALKVSLARDGR